MSWLKHRLVVIALLGCILWQGTPIPAPACGTPQQVCIYLYAHGSPVNGTDPSGHANLSIPSLLTAAGTIGTLASQHLSAISRQAGPLFAAGGRHAWAARQAFGRFAENIAHQVVSLVRTSVPNLQISENVQRGSRYIDLVLRNGQRAMDLEVKYKLPDRTGQALTRLVSQTQSSVAAAEAQQTVIWTFKEPHSGKCSL